MENFFKSINRFFESPPLNFWLGVIIEKNPLDLMILQEILFEKKPDTIIECGTKFGGSAYFMACIMDVMNIEGKVITIDRETVDTKPMPGSQMIKINGKMKNFKYDVYHQRPQHPKIHYILSDCLKADIPKLGKRTMVILDCNHEKEHVEKELKKYSKLVSPGQYIIVEDTDEPNGPAEAIKKFLKSNKNFVIDTSREKFGVSSNLGGYLLRIS